MTDFSPPGVSNPVMSSNAKSIPACIHRTSTAGMYKAVDMYARRKYNSIRDIPYIELADARSEGRKEVKSRQLSRGTI